MTSLKTLPLKGLYTLVILLNAENRITVRKLGCFTFEKGFYAYTGSALGAGSTSLIRRVARHLRTRKTKHWHIDFLLSNKNARVTTVVAAESNVNTECQMNRLIKSIVGSSIPVLGFGSSDCKQSCGSHLVYFGEKNVEKEIVAVYYHLFDRRTLVCSVTPFIE